MAPRIARRWLGLVMLGGVLVASPGVHAGRACETETPPQAQQVERSLDLAARTLAALDASGQQVVVLARAGQDLSKYGLYYSHLGFAYRQPHIAPDGKSGHVWRVLHKLNQCGTAEASVYRQGLGDFFLENLWRFEASWVVPSREVQDRLMPLLLDANHDGRALSLHHKPYSVVSYAWGRKYQQSNQWAIEVLAASAEPAVRTREQAQAWLQFKGYTPTTLRIGPLTRLGGRVGQANIAFDDHPNDKRYSDRIETVTVDSVFDWLPRAGLAGAPATLGPKMP
ncbi:MAG: DUF2145 domain-containing protein [Haliea sp.]|nr:MAG: DUF2145 domain-containing protein [Haliea sp.]